MLKISQMVPLCLEDHVSDPNLLKLSSSLGQCICRQFSTALGFGFSSQIMKRPAVARWGARDHIAIKLYAYGIAAVYVVCWLWQITVRNSVFIGITGYSCALNVGKRGLGSCVCMCTR